MKLKGKIDKVTYFNNENNYGVVRCLIDASNKEVIAKINNEYITVTSTFFSKPQKNETYVFEGEVITNKYGICFKSDIAKEDTSSKQGLINYLSSDEFKGVGVKLAKAIYEALGDELIDKIANDRSALDSVKGLKSDLKDLIYDKIRINALNSKTITSLMNLGLTYAFSLKIFNEYGLDAYFKIKENPYTLMSDVDNVGFLKCDDIALNKLNMSKNNPIRLKALILYVITTITYQTSNSYFIKDDLYQKVNEISSISYEEYEKYLFQLVDEKKLFIDRFNNIYDYFIYSCEKKIAQSIKELLECDVDEFDNLDNLLDEVQKNNNLKLNTLQLQAVKNVVQNNISIVTGGPGTGKSTIISSIINLYLKAMGNEYVKDEIYLLAPTGKAAKRMEELSGCNAQTIHRFLGYKGQNVYQYGFGQIKLCAMIIVDEASMIDTILLARLLTSITPDTKVVFVGDSDQLPSVGVGNTLNDLIKCGYIPVTKLTQIHRQKENSTIIDLAKCVNNGYLPSDLLQKTIDRSFVPLKDNDIVDAIIKTYKKAIEVNGDSINDIGILIPMYKGVIGIDEVNKRIQDAINPYIDYEVKHYNNRYRINDKIINLVNNVNKQVMNGDTGTIIDIDYDDEGFNKIICDFDGKEVEYQFSELNEIQLAYAISIHKAQGQEYKTVIMPISFKYYIMLNRKLVYTAITRSKKYLIMFGDPKALEYASRVNNQNRLSMLDVRIKNELENTNIIDDARSAFSEVYDLELTPYSFMEKNSNNN